MPLQEHRVRARTRGVLARPMPPATLDGMQTWGAAERRRSESPAMISPALLTLSARLMSELHDT